MFSRWSYLLLKLRKKLWFPSVFYAFFGVAAALLALAVGQWLPSADYLKIGADSVDGILTIMASSMLGVATFALATMVSSYGNASRSATPRATKLLLQDRTAQKALATFIGGFLYSVVGLVALATRSYGVRGRFVLFVFTALMVVLIVINILRLIARLSTLGLMHETIERVENATREALDERLKRPARFYDPEVFRHPVPLKGERVGYLVRVHFDVLERICAEQKVKLRMKAVAGAFIYKEALLAELSGAVSAEALKNLREAFVIEHERTFEQDPRFGFIVLAEIASRALSPAVNDPGTAIAVLGSGVRLLTYWQERLAVESEAPADIIWVYPPALAAEDLFDDLFSPLGRDAAPVFEVGIRLQKSLRALARSYPEQLAEPARLQSRRALEQSLACLRLAEDQERLKMIFEEVQG